MDKDYFYRKLKKAAESCEFKTVRDTDRLTNGNAGNIYGGYTHIGHPSEERNAFPTCLQGCIEMFLSPPPPAAKNIFCPL